MQYYAIIRNIVSYSSTSRGMEQFVPFNGLLSTPQYKNLSFESCLLIDKCHTKFILGIYHIKLPSDIFFISPKTFINYSLLL